MRNKVIVILADSLSMPRPEGLGNIRFVETYPYLLDASLRNLLGKDSPIVLEKGQRSRTISDVANDWKEYVSWRKPDVVIVQVGITDCAPRVFTPKQRAIVERIPVIFIREMLLKFVHKYRRQIITLFPNRVYTPLKKYRDTVVKLVELANQDGVEALIFVNIVCPPDSLEARSPGLQENVRLYNNVLDKIKSRPGVYVIEINELIQNQEDAESHILDDGEHLSVLGNKLLAKHLEHLVAQVLFA